MRSELLTQAAKISAELELLMVRMTEEQRIETTFRMISLLNRNMRYTLYNDVKKDINADHLNCIIITDSTGDQVVRVVDIRVGAMWKCAAETLEVKFPAAHGWYRGAFKNWKMLNAQSYVCGICEHLGFTYTVSYAKK